MPQYNHVNTLLKRVKTCMVIQSTYIFYITLIFIILEIEIICIKRVLSMMRTCKIKMTNMYQCTQKFSKYVFLCIVKYIQN